MAEGILGVPDLSNQIQQGIPVLDVCGHSIPGAGGTVGGDQHAYPHRLAKMLGAREIRNIANGGAIACWPSGNAAGDGGRDWIVNNFMPPTAPGAPYLPRTTVAVVHVTQNDVGALGSRTPRPMQEALRLILSRYCAAAQFPDTDASWTYGGGMSTAAGVQLINGSEHFINNQPVNQATQWAQFAVPADYKAGQVVALAVGGVPGLGLNATVTLAITVDGVTQPDYQMYLDKSGIADAENGKLGIVALRFGRADCGLQIPLADGAHTIRVAVKSVTNSATTGFIVFQGSWIEADPLDGPLLVVPGAYRCTSPTLGGYALWSSALHGPSAGTDPLTDASIIAWQAAEKAVLADFPGRSLYVDLDSVLQKNSKWFFTNGVGDGAHPTNEGHSLIAETIYTAIMSSGLLTQRRIARTDRLGSNNGFGGGLWRPMGGAFGTSIGLTFTNSWVATGGAAVPLPAYRKDLDGKVHMRGAVSSGSAGNAVITSFGAGYQPERFKDNPVEVYDGTTVAIGTVRISQATSSGQVFFALNGKNAGAGHFNFITLEWQAEK